MKRPWFYTTTDPKPGIDQRLYRTSPAEAVFELLTERLRWEVETEMWAIVYG